MNRLTPAQRSNRPRNAAAIADAEGLEHPAKRAIHRSAFRVSRISRLIMDLEPDGNPFIGDRAVGISSVSSLQYQLTVAAKPA